MRLSLWTLKTLQARILCALFVLLCKERQDYSDPSLFCIHRKLFHFPNRVTTNVLLLNPSHPAPSTPPTAKNTLLKLQITFGQKSWFLGFWKITTLKKIKTFWGIWNLIFIYLHLQSFWFLASSKPGLHSQATPPLGVSRQMCAHPWSLFIQFIPSVKKRDRKMENISIEIKLQNNYTHPVILTVILICIWPVCHKAKDHIWEEVYNHQNWVIKDKPPLGQRQQVLLWSTGRLCCT